MRIVSTTLAPRQAAPVAAVERADARQQQDRAIARGKNAAGARSAGTHTAMVEQARTPRKYLQADPAMVGIGLTAQNMFHSQNGAPAEENIIRATNAYSQSESIRLARGPHALRIA